MKKGDFNEAIAVRDGKACDEDLRYLNKNRNPSSKPDDNYVVNRAKILVSIYAYISKFDPLIKFWRNLLSVVDRNCILLQRKTFIARGEGEGLST